MAFPNFVHLTNASPGAPRNSGTNGDLCALLDWALPQVGWAIEFTSGNARVYRPAVGNRFRLHVNHDSGTSGAAQKAVVRGCEDASNATTLIDPFPTVAQVADTNSNWLVSTTANTTARAFHIVAWDTGVIYMSNASGGANLWSFGMYCDTEENGDPDSWGTILSQRSNTTTSGNVNVGVATTFSAGSALHWARSIDGVVKSASGHFYGSGATMGQVTGGPTLTNGIGGKVRREAVFANCNSSLLLRRGAVPNIWQGIALGLGTITDADTFTDTAYNPASLFVALQQINNQGCVLLETTNTWDVP